MAQKTKQDYEEWKIDTLRMFNSKQHLTDAVWNAIHQYAERAGVDDMMDADEDDMSICIEDMLSNFTNLK